MECMCAWTRPRFILSSEEFWGNGVQTHVNSKGKSPLPERKILLRGGSNPGCCIKQTASPIHYPLSYSAPPPPPPPAAGFEPRASRSPGRRLTTGPPRRVTARWGYDVILSVEAVTLPAMGRGWGWGGWGEGITS